MELFYSLARQFSREDADAYHGLIAQAAPWLEREVTRLRADHQALLAHVWRLVSLTRHRAREEFSAAVVDFTALLDAHERSEAELMREFLQSGDLDA